MRKIVHIDMDAFYASVKQHGGNIYVTQHIHPNIEYLYRVECRPDR